MSAVTWRIPLAQPYAYLEITAEDATSFSELADSLFGEGTGTRILAEGVVTSVLGATQSGTPDPVQPSVPAQQPTQAPAATGLTCPQCGVGKIVTKTRKDKKGTFDGCDQFPRCNYIVKNVA